MFLKITIRFFLILISCVVTLLIAEFIFNKFRSANQFYQKIIAPEPHSDTESKQGFRVESEDIVYSEDKGDYFRIICLGDSFTLGFGVSDDKTYPAFLERYLKDIFQKRTQVINAGHAGSTIPEQIDFYREKCLQLEHDLVLLLFNTGDLIDLAEETLFRKSENKQKEYGPFILDKYLMGKSKIYTLIVDAIITMKNKNPAIDYYVENKAAIIDEYLKHLSNLSKIVRSKEVILASAITAVLESLHPIEGITLPKSVYRMLPSMECLLDCLCYAMFVQLCKHIVTYWALI